MPSTDSALKKMSEMPDSEINPNGWKNTLLRKEYHEGVVYFGGWASFFVGSATLKNTNRSQ